MVAFNNEISSADKIGLHLSEIGRLQNNAGSLLQFMALLFAVCVYFYNDMIFPSTDHRTIYASLLAVTAAFILAASLPDAFRWLERQGQASQDEVSPALDAVRGRDRRHALRNR